MRHSLSILVAWTALLAGCSCTSDLGADGADGGARIDAQRPAPRTDECGNGLDDDGNGLIDDGCPCGPGETQRCFSGALSSNETGACRSGIQTCDAPPGVEWSDWGRSACEGEVLPGEEACDGTDADCDGAVDEGCPCTDGMRSDCGVEFVTAPCMAGTQTCRAGTWNGCEGAVRPSPDVCDDGIDNDCDGEVDDGCACMPSPEICRDGIDNDCDREIDEPACTPDWSPDAGVPGDGGATPDDAGAACSCEPPSDQGAVAISFPPTRVNSLRFAFVGGQWMVVWLNDDDGYVHLSRVDVAGTVLSDVPITGGPRAAIGMPGERGSLRDATWTGSEWLILFQPDSTYPTPGPTHLIRVSATGELLEDAADIGRAYQITYGAALGIVMAIGRGLGAIDCPITGSLPCESYVELSFASAVGGPRTVVPLAGGTRLHPSVHRLRADGDRVLVGYSITYNADDQRLAAAAPSGVIYDREIGRLTNRPGDFARGGEHVLYCATRAEQRKAGPSSTECAIVNAADGTVRVPWFEALPAADTMNMSVFADAGETIGWDGCQFLVTAAHPPPTLSLTPRPARVVSVSPAGALGAVTPLRLPSGWSASWAFALVRTGDTSFGLIGSAGGPRGLDLAAVEIGVCGAR